MNRIFNKLRKIEANNGFSLVELLVVVAIVGVLALVAVPTFLAQREKAEKADATSALKNSLTSLSTLRDNGEWSSYSNEITLGNALEADQEQFNYIDRSVASTNNETINVYMNDDKNLVVMTVKNGDGYRCVKQEGNNEPVWGGTISGVPDLTDCVSDAAGAPADPEPSFVAGKTNSGAELALTAGPADANHDINGAPFLNTSQYLKSANGQYYLVLDATDHIIIYDSDENVVWKATDPTAGLYIGPYGGGYGAATTLVLGGDGHFVLYGPAWPPVASFYYNLYGYYGPQKFGLSDGGKLELYWGGSLVWSS